MSVQYQKRYFNVDEYFRMTEAGVLTESDHVELIEGEIIEMSPIGSRHAACVRKLGALLTRSLDHIAIVSIQSPVRLSDFSEPQPDIALLNLRDDFYAQSHPTPEDVLVVIEIGDTSVEYDRSIKAPLYARAGIVEAWIIDLDNEIIEIYSEPSNNLYQKREIANRGEVVNSRVISALKIKVDEIL